MKVSSGKELSGAESSGAPGPIIASQRGVPTVPPPDDALFGRVASILDQARASVVRAVKHNMVLAYWLIGREIVMELQRGNQRAGYGERVVADLSKRLTRRYGGGWSKSNLAYFRLFYSVYAEREERIFHTVCGKSGQPAEIKGAFAGGGVENANERQAFTLSWSHHRTLIRLDDSHARNYYEQDAECENLSVRQLERLIRTRAYERLLATQMRRDGGPRGRGGTGRLSPNPNTGPSATAAATDAVEPAGRLTPVAPLDTLKDPYVLEFLDIPDPAALRERGLEGAIIAHLRDFMLELGKGHGG